MGHGKDIMAEAFAVVSLVQTIVDLTKIATVVVKRLNEYNNNVADLPECFQHMSNQLPILIRIVNSFQERRDNGEFSKGTEAMVAPVVIASKAKLEELDTLLAEMSPDKGSRWEKAKKAIRSVGVQKKVDQYASVIKEYIQCLNAFQTDQLTDQMKMLSQSMERYRIEQRQMGVNADQMRLLSHLIEQQHFQQQKSEVKTLESHGHRQPIWMPEFGENHDFVGRETVMKEISERFETEMKRVAVTGIGGVGYVRLVWLACNLASTLTRRQQI